MTYRELATRYAEAQIAFQPYASELLAALNTARERMFEVWRSTGHSMNWEYAYFAIAQRIEIAQVLPEGIAVEADDGSGYRHDLTIPISVLDDLDDYLAHLRVQLTKQHVQEVAQEKTLHEQLLRESFEDTKDDEAFYIAD